MSYPATITVYNSAGLLPFVLVNYPSAAAGCVAMRIEQTAEGRTWQVRGGIGIAPNTPLAVFEVPFNVPATFRAEMFSSYDMAEGTSLGYTDPATVTLPSDVAWVHQPLSPSLATTVDVHSGTAARIVRPVPGELVWADNASLPRRSGKRRRGIVGLDFIMETATLAQADMLESMLGGYGESEQQSAILCFRTPGPTPRIPRMLIASVDDGELIEEDISVEYGGERLRWPLRLTETLPPAPALAASILSYDDLDAAYPAGYTARDAAYASYTAMDTDFSKAGLAG